MVGAEAPSGLAGPLLGAPQRISILGATGSVGKSALDLIGRSPERYRVEALTANGAAEDLARLARQHGAKFAAVADPKAY